MSRLLPIPLLALGLLISGGALTACGVQPTPAPRTDVLPAPPPASPLTEPATSVTPTPPMTSTPAEAVPSPSSDSGAASVVKVEMRALSFTFDPASVPAAEPFAFLAANTGSRHYELALVQLNIDDKALLAVLQSGSTALDSIPEGVALLGRTGPVAPGDEATLAVEGLEPGRYALVSLLPDEFDTDYVLQVFKGMVAEFRVGTRS